MSDEKLETPRVTPGVERELKYFRGWFSLMTFLLCAVAFIIGFPALEDAGKKIGLGPLAFGLPFAIDLGMVTLLLWSMWNRGTLKRWWPPMIPAVLLLGLSSWLQYIHAVELISDETPELARWGLLILAAALPLLLALSAGVFESVTFAPLIDRAKRFTEVQRAQEAVDDELWRMEAEERRRQVTLEAELKRSRIELESKTQLKVLEAEAEAAARALKGNRSGAPKPPMKPAKAKLPETSSTPDSPGTQIASPDAQEPVNIPSEETSNRPQENTRGMAGSNDAEALAAAVAAVQSGELSQRAAAEKFQVTRSTLRRRLEGN